MKKKNRVILPFLIIVFTVLTIIYSEAASQKAVTSMQNAVQRIIPALFPYMVVSSLIISSGAAEILGRLLPVSSIFSLPKCASTPIVLGALCGFPLGAKSASELYENGYISKTEAEVLISTANNTGPTFLIFVVGSAFWGNTSFGAFLYIAQILSALSASVIINRILFPIRHTENISSPVVIIKPFISSFADAIRSASSSSLYVCGFITFFSVVSSILSEMLSFLPTKFLIITKAFLEFSEASYEAVAFDGIYGAFICGFAIGWSGLSVFCQTASFTAPLGLSLKRCFAVKLIQGLFLGAASAIYAYCTQLESTTECFVTEETSRLLPTITIITALTGIYSIYLIKKRKGA